MRTTRGYTIVAALCDEIAFWPHEDAAEPDYEVLNRSAPFFLRASLTIAAAWRPARPGMATIPNAMLLCASSPYARRGALWDAHRQHFGKDNDPILVWQADTRTMNPCVPQQVIDAATEQDPASAAAEWLAHFRSDVQALLTCEAVCRVSARVTILDAVDDANLFAPWFREPATWAAWRAFLAALFALKMSSEQLAIGALASSAA